MKQALRRTKAFTLVEIMIVVLIIGILLAIAVPNFLSARQSSRATTIIANLREIDDAKEHCAMTKELSVGDTCPDFTPYLNHYPPRFPVSGALVEGAVGSFATFRGKTASQWATDKTGL